LSIGKNIEPQRERERERERERTSPGDIYTTKYIIKTIFEQIMAK
jgi:hypothetical protein